MALIGTCCLVGLVRSRLSQGEALRAAPADTCTAPSRHDIPQPPTPTPHTLANPQMKSHPANFADLRGHGAAKTGHGHGNHMMQSPRAHSLQCSRPTAAPWSYCAWCVVTPSTGRARCASPSLASLGRQHQQCDSREHRSAPHAYACAVLLEPLTSQQVFWALGR